MKNKNYLVVILSVVSLLQFSCNRTSSDTDSVNTSEQMAQQVSEVLTSVDDAGGSSSGALGLMSTSDVQQYGACSSATFSSCSSGVMTKSYSSCTNSYGTGSGSITLTFSDSGCSMAATSSYVTRVPSYSITTSRGSVYAVSANSAGQKLTKTGSGTYTYANSGIKRTFTLSNGTKLLDVSVSTGSDLLVNGASRAGRTITSGTLTVTNNLNSESCTLSPSSLTWVSGCKCPTSGSISGQCTSGDNFSVTYGSCGSATLTKGSDTISVSLDRCSF